MDYARTRETLDSKHEKAKINHVPFIAIKVYGHQKDRYKNM